MISRRKPERRRAASRHEAVRQRDDVLAIVAHDLRSPISTILMAAELLRHEHGDASVSRLLDMITTAAKQADVLIRDLVDVARIESGRFSIDPAREPLACILSSVTEPLAEQAAKCGVMLACDRTDVAGLAVMVDHSRFVQLLSNLIDNAIKYTPAGGSVRVSAVAENGMVKISVQDTGSGISSSELPHVFERFWQAERHQRAGAGLGLGIAKGIVEAHGGNIGAVSTEGVGSTFYFTLPLVTPE